MEEGGATFVSGNRKKQVIWIVWNKSTCHLRGCPDCDSASRLSCADLRGRQSAPGCSAGAVSPSHHPAASPLSTNARSDAWRVDDVCACMYCSPHSVVFYLLSSLRPAGNFWFADSLNCTCPTLIIVGNLITAQWFYFIRSRASDNEKVCLQNSIGEHTLANRFLKLGQTNSLPTYIVLSLPISCKIRVKTDTAIISDPVAAVHTLKQWLTCDLSHNPNMLVCSVNRCY